MTKKPKEVTTLFSEANTGSSDLCWFVCVKCNGVALATNGALLLPKPGDPMGLQGWKQVDVNFLYCHNCDILENMDDKTVAKSEEEATLSEEGIRPEPEHLQVFHQKILDYLQK